jgi:hypothetical protein
MNAAAMKESALQLFKKNRGPQPAIREKRN